LGRTAPICSWSPIFPEQRLQLSLCLWSDDGNGLRGVGRPALRLCSSHPDRRERQERSAMNAQRSLRPRSMATKSSTIALARSAQQGMRLQMTECPCERGGDRCYVSDVTAKRCAYSCDHTLGRSQSERRSCDQRYGHLCGHLLGRDQTYDHRPPRQSWPPAGHDARCARQR
jgi:hypothetical protein